MRFSSREISSRIGRRIGWKIGKRIGSKELESGKDWEKPRLLKEENGVVWSRQR